MSHTPGPWVWRHKSGSLHQAGTDRPYGATVLTPNYEYDTGVSIEASDADFALIAAAPDLLAACREAKEFLVPYLTEPGRTVFWKLVDAIRRAEGRTP